MIWLFTITVFNQDIVTGKEISKTHAAYLLTSNFLCKTTSGLAYSGWRETLLSRLRGNINSSIKFINCVISPENEPEKCFLSPFITIKKSHAEMVFVVWPRALSWEEQKIIDLFQGNNTEMFLTPLLLYLLYFLPQISSSSAIIFPECHGLSCVHLPASC